MSRNLGDKELLEKYGDGREKLVTDGLSGQALLDFEASYKILLKRLGERDRYHAPCDKHQDMEIWIAQIESDKSECFGCFVEAREKKAIKSLQDRIVELEKEVTDTNLAHNFANEAIGKYEKDLEAYRNALSTPAEELADGIYKKGSYPILLEYPSHLTTIMEDVLKFLNAKVKGE